MFEPTLYDCPRCQIGHCHLGTTTYTRILNGQVISVPNIVVYTCDVCYFQEFDREALFNLQTLLGAGYGNPQEDARPVAKTPTVEDALETGKSPRPKP